MKTKIIGISILILNTVYAQNKPVLTDTCTPKKSELILKSICTQIKSKTSAELQKTDSTLLKTIIYDDCGITTPLIVQAKPPYKILQSIGRPQQVGIELEKNLPTTDEVPLIVVSAGSNENSVTEFKDISMIVSAAKASKYFWGLNCKVADSSIVTITTSQIMATEKLFIGSSPIHIDFSMLSDSNVSLLLSSQTAISEKSNIALKLAEKIIDNTYQRTALALNLPAKLIQDILISKLKSPDFSNELTQVITESLASSSELASFNLVMGIGQIFEKTLFNSRAIRFFIQKSNLDYLKKSSSNEERLMSLEEQVALLENKITTANKPESQIDSTDLTNKKSSSQSRINNILGIPIEQFSLAISSVSLLIGFILAWKVFLK